MQSCIHLAKLPEAQVRKDDEQLENDGDGALYVRRSRSQTKDFSITYMCGHDQFSIYGIAAYLNDEDIKQDFMLPFCYYIVSHGR